MILERSQESLGLKAGRHLSHGGPGRVSPPDQTVRVLDEVIKDLDHVGPSLCRERARCPCHSPGRRPGGMDQAVHRRVVRGESEVVFRAERRGAAGNPAGVFESGIRRHSVESVGVSRGMAPHPPSPRAQSRGFGEISSPIHMRG